MQKGIWNLTLWRCWLWNLSFVGSCMLWFFFLVERDNVGRWNLVQEGHFVDSFLIKQEGNTTILDQLCLTKHPPTIAPKIMNEVCWAIYVVFVGCWILVGFLYKVGKLLPGLCEFYWWVRFLNDRCEELLRWGQAYSWNVDHGLPPWCQPWGKLQYKMSVWLPWIPFHLRRNRFIFLLFSG